MRGHFVDVVRRRRWGGGDRYRLSDWWVDAPYRRRSFWSQLLFERGQGWLRWGADTREIWEWESNACAYYCDYVQTVAPPARRLARYLWQWPTAARLMTIGHKFDSDVTGDYPIARGERYRFSWEEARPCWPSDMRDEERARIRR